MRLTARPSTSHSLPPASVTGQRGFTLIELIVTLSLLGLLLAAALPSFSTWLRNTKARSVADSLQTGIRLAQAESIRRNRQVVFSLTNASPGPSAAAAANGRNWVIRTVAVPGENPEFVQGGSLGSMGANIAVTGVQSLCFNSFGRLVANTDPGASGTGGTSVTTGACVLPTAPALAFEYDFSAPGSADGDRRYRVTVALGGQIRLCDRDRSLATAVDGCA